MQKNDNNKQTPQNSVKVFIRVRPLISIEANTRNIVQVRPDEQSVTIYIDEYNQIQTKFDRIISQQRNQKEMFGYVQPYIDEILNGFNLTIFAYGQTGSGKTYTMFGRDWENNFSILQKEKGKKNAKQNTPLTDVTNDDENAGLIPRSAYHLFQSLAQYPNEYNLFCSFIQIYNEKVYDLLQDSPIPNPLNIHQSRVQGIFVEGLGEFQVNDYTDCLELMKRGEKNRFIRQTSMNAKSSRSHTIFQILVQSTKANHRGVYTKTRLNLCDLAGSQKINKKEAMGEDHLNELKNINLSLTTLGKVINALSKGPCKNLAIFRESKLTRLLQESLVGNTNTLIIGAISPSLKNRDETLNTLKFVQRARHIKLTIKPSQISNESEDLVKRLQAELEQLKRILREKSDSKIPKQVQNKLSKLQQENKKLKSEFESKNSDIYTLVNENREIKKALALMQNEKRSNRSFHISGSYDNIPTNLPLQQNSPMDLKIKSRESINSRYSIQTNASRNVESLPPIIRQKRNQSMEGQYLYDPKLNNKTIDYNEKKRIINKLQQLQTLKKAQEIKLLDDMDIMQKSHRMSSSRNKLKLSGTPSPEPNMNQEIRPRPKQKIDFSAKIKELQNRLMKSNR